MLGAHKIEQMIIICRHLLHGTSWKHTQYVFNLLYGSIFYLGQITDIGTYSRSRYVFMSNYGSTMVEDDDVDGSFLFMSKNLSIKSQQIKANSSF